MTASQIAATRRIPPGLVWVAPVLLVLAGLSIYPLLYLIKVSLSDAHGFTLAHYTRLFHDRLFGQTALYASAALTLEFLLGLALALLWIRWRAAGR
jgi:ABC-type sugar transport system permease subunit